jgi:hypothetical protein
VQLFERALDQLEPTPLVGLGSSRAPFVSPDGQWIGFVETGSAVMVKKVAITGGRNGQELFYLAPPNGALMSVHVERGSTWTAGTPTKLLDGQYYFGGGTPSRGRTTFRPMARSF